MQDIDQDSLHQFRILGSAGGDKIATSKIHRFSYVNEQRLYCGH
jgi:hypothetical protein